MPIEMEIQGERSDYIFIDPCLVVSTIADKLQLYGLVETIFSDKIDKILDISVFMIMSKNNV